MLKVLLLQVCIDNGHLDWKKSGSNESEFLKVTLMSTVENYALKFGYSYKCVEVLDQSLAQLPVNSMSPRMNVTFEKYMHLALAENYDYLVIIDADMLVAESCPALPLAPGFSGAPNWQWRINRYHPDWIGRCILVNAGFQIFDKKTALRFSQYFKDCLENPSSVLYTNYYHDEVFLAEFMRLNTDIVYNNLGQMWNDTEISHDNRLPFNEAYMYHLAGPFKETKYKRIKSCLVKQQSKKVKKPVVIEPNKYTRTRVRKT